MSRFDSDLDHDDWLHGPYEAPNATCPQCHREFVKGRDDLGDLCDQCARDAWTDAQERRTVAKKGAA